MTGAVWCSLRVTCLTLAWLLCAPSLTAGDVQVLLDKSEALAQVFPGADRVVELRHLLTAGESDAISELAKRDLDEGGFYLYRATRRGELLGYATVVSQVGKVRPITHIVGVTPEGRVGRVAVMIYRESHGGEVAAERFLDQYRGLTLDDPVRLEVDVVNIAGATLSGHAICRGVRKALAAVQVLFLDADPAELDLRLATATDVTPATLQDPGAASGRDGVLVRRDSDGQVLRAERRVMGSLCSVELRAIAGGPSTDALEAAARAALDEVARWDSVLSDWRPDTPLSQLNRATAGRPVRVPADLAAFLDHASWAQQVTGGAFDAGLGALVAAWGLRSQEPARPDTATLAEARAASGTKHLLLDLEAGTAVRLHDGLLLDPGGSGKGWALDRAAEVLAARGVTSGLLSFRSTLLALGPPPGEDAWVLPVLHDGAGVVVARVPLAHGALSVSGGSVSRFLDGAVERGGVLDPASAEPVPAERQAWVLHSSAASADALSTALLVRGPSLPSVPDATGVWLERADGTPSPWPAR